MQAVSVTRVLVWSRWLRLSHWFLALSSIGLIVTGWLMSVDPLLAIDAKDFHYILSGLLLPALLLRLYLLFFGNGPDHLTDCELDIHRLNQASDVLRFYLTLGRTTLPRWFGHNPLWGPIYLFLFLFLVISSFSGVLLLQEIPSIFGISNHDLHGMCHYVISLFVLLHLPAVFSHDLSSKSSDISGMVNGYKIFQVEKPSLPGNTQIQTISLDELLKSRK